MTNRTAAHQSLGRLHVPLHPPIQYDVGITNHSIRAVFFDFDGTLVDSERLHYESWLDAVRPQRGHMEWPEYKQLLTGRSDREAGALLLSRAGVEPTTDLVENACRVKTERYKARFLDELTIEPQVVSWIRNSPVNLHVGVVTSSGEHEVAPILIKEDIRTSLSLLVCGDQVGNLKPHPEPYLLAMDRANEAVQTHSHAPITKLECLALEDSEAGIDAARAAGIRVAQVGSPGEVWQILLDEGLATT